MEGEMNDPPHTTVGFVWLPLVAILFASSAIGQTLPERDVGRMNLRKSVSERDYNGKRIEGEGRIVSPGDSLWRILIQEKKLPENKFGQYLVVIRGLNPNLKSIDMLRVGDNIFVPVHPDDALGIQSMAGKRDDTSASSIPIGTTKEYRVKQGDHLYQILREQLGIKDKREQAVYYALVKDLNRERKQWDILQEGEVIRLPTVSENRGVAAAGSKRDPSTALERPIQSPQTAISSEAKSGPQQPLPLDYARKLSARDNLPLLEQVAMALGSEIQRNGQEVVALKNGNVVLERSAYPVIYNPKLQQRVIIDSAEQIPV
ncbi:MAG: hypothetical protein ACREO5_08175, partial [Candidatus Binatia bacterium]